jgi:acetyl esterase
MPVDPQVQLLLDQLAAMGGPELHEMEPVQARQVVAAMAQLGPPPEDVAETRDHPIPVPGGSISARSYRPMGTEGTLPVVVFYHGGGWVICDVDMYDAECRRLANLSGCLVFSVEYRLAPEHRFPTAVDDAYAALLWVAEHAPELGGDPSRLAVAGDSAGGNLSAVVSLLARDRQGPAIAFQALIYPAVDFGTDWPSLTENGEGYFLTRAGMEWFGAHYRGEGTDANDPRLSPLRAPSLAGLPPALVLTAEFDPLRDQGEAYAAALEKAGVPVTLHRYDGMIHGFWTMAGVVSRGTDAMDEVAGSLRQALTGRLSPA